MALWEGCRFSGTHTQNGANSLPGLVTFSAAAHACSHRRGRMDGEARSDRNTICGLQQEQLALGTQVLVAEICPADGWDFGEEEQPQCLLLGDKGSFQSGQDSRILF